LIKAKEVVRVKLSSTRAFFSFFAGEDIRKKSSLSSVPFQVALAEAKKYASSPNDILQPLFFFFFLFSSATF